MASVSHKIVESSSGGTGLRQRQKKRRRAEIMAAGKDLFAQQGYASTSMEAIAERAEVGIATVYNYFGSKGRLLAEIQTPEFDILFEQGQALLQKPPADPIRGALSLIDVYRGFQNNWAEKGILLAAMGPGLSAEPVLDDLAQQVETRVKQQIEDLLRHYQTAGQVRTSIDISDAATIIFYIFNQHFIEYITQPDADYAKMAQQMDRQIGFIITAISA